MRHAGLQAWDVSQQVKNTTALSESWTVLSQSSAAKQDTWASHLTIVVTIASPLFSLPPPGHCMFLVDNSRRLWAAAQRDEEITFISIIKYTEYDWLWTQRGRWSPARFLFIMLWYLSDGLQCRNKRPMNGAHPVLICLLNIRVNFQMYL